MDGDHHYLLTKYGMNAFPSYYVQEQVYTLGLNDQDENIDECDFYAKEKEHNLPYSLIIPYDKKYSVNKVEEIDRILLDGWIPESIENPACPYCWHTEICFNADVIDLSKYMCQEGYDDLTIRLAQARMMQEKGKAEEDAVKEILIKLAGDKDSAIIGGIKGTLTVSEVASVNKQKILKEFGEVGLMKVLEFSPRRYWTWRIRS
jgi:hypothetical protein